MSSSPPSGPKSAGARAADRPDGDGTEAGTAAPADLNEQEAPPPACVMSFNAADPSGAGGVAGDVATLAAMGAHALPVTCGVLIRDSAEIFDHHELDAEVITEQARTVLEDITVSGWKVGFLGSAEGVSAVAEILSDYPELPLVAYLPNLGWLDDDAAQTYHEAFRDLILPATELLVGSHKTLTDFLLPDWDSERPPSARELAVAAAERGTRYVLVTGILLPVKGGVKPGAEQYIDNVLASSQGAISGEKFEMFDTSFVGAGDTLSAALAALLASGSELQAAVGEALSFMDQTLDAGFRPGMGSVVPDRFFWALPPEEGVDPGTGLPLEGQAPAAADAGTEPGPEAKSPKGPQRRVH